MVAKLDRLARSIRDARDIADDLTAKGVRLQLGSSVHDPTDPIGKLLFGFLSLMAEFESDLIRQRTREGMAVARSRGRLKGRGPKLSATQQQHLVKQHETGEYSISELAELFSVGRATVYRTLQRHEQADGSI